MRAGEPPQELTRDVSGRAEAVVHSRQANAPPSREGRNPLASPAAQVAGDRPPARVAATNALVEGLRASSEQRKCCRADGT